MCSVKNFTIFTTPALESSSIKKDFNTGVFSEYCEHHFEEYLRTAALNSERYMKDGFLL